MRNLRKESCKVDFFVLDERRSLRKKQAPLYCVWVWKWRDFLSKVSCIFHLSKEQCLQANVACILPEDLDTILATEENWCNASSDMHSSPYLNFCWPILCPSHFSTSVREFDHKKVIAWCLKKMLVVLFRFFCRLLEMMQYKVGYPQLL